MLDRALYHAKVGIKAARAACLGAEPPEFASRSIFACRGEGVCRMQHKA